jgi:hypothetical protein
MSIFTEITSPDRAVSFYFVFKKIKRYKRIAGLAPEKHKILSKILCFLIHTVIDDTILKYVARGEVWHAGILEI